MFAAIPCLSLKKRSYHDVTETIGKSCLYLCSVYSSILPFITDRWRVNSFLIGHCRYREQLITKRSLMSQTKLYPLIAILQRASNQSYQCCLIHLIKLELKFFD